jgi:hypothetical protein
MSSYNATRQPEFSSPLDCGWKSNLEQVKVGEMPLAGANDCVCMYVYVITHGDVRVRSMYFYTAVRSMYVSATSTSV